MDPIKISSLVSIIHLEEIIEIVNSYLNVRFLLLKLIKRSFFSMNTTEKLVSSTVMLQTDIGVDTGFYYKIRKDENGNFKPVIVRNSHVFEGAGRLNIHIRCTIEPYLPI